MIAVKKEAECRVLLLLEHRVVYRANIIKVCPKRETDAFFDISEKSPNPQQSYQAESTSQGVLLLNTSFGIASAYHFSSTDNHFRGP
jgi:hypothetical protein